LATNTGSRRRDRSADDRSGLRVTSAGRAAGRTNARRVYPVFNRAALTESRGEYHFRPHRHPGYEVIVVRRGVYRAGLNGEPFALRPGQGLVAKPGDLHEDICRPPLVYFAVGFELVSDLEAAPEPPALFAPGVAPSLQVFRVDLTSAWPLVRRIQEEAGRPDEFSAHVQDALLLEFFWMLLRALPREAVSDLFLDLSLSQAFPAQLMRVFRANLSRSLNLAEMARLMGISRSTLSHKCRSLLGVSPARAFNRCRMERGAQLLCNTSLQVKEVAFRLGFEDQFAFSRAFRRHFGQSPSDLREERS
jgi:AraC-like DNA-binding protein